MKILSNQSAIIAIYSIEKVFSFCMSPLPVCWGIFSFVSFKSPANVRSLSDLGIPHGCDNIGGLVTFSLTLSIFLLCFLHNKKSRCGCDDCVTSRQEDSLRHSRSRINAYRALASPSLVALSSKDPILTAFELSWELRRLSFLEHEFKVKK